MKTNLLTAAIVLGSAWAAHAAEPARTAVLLELFTSEGCSSCPPADRLLETLDRTQPLADAELIVLSEHVDYWDRLGWKDPFSSAEVTDRQRQYSNAFQIESIYTPELVIDGRKEVVGNDAAAAQAAIADAIKAPKAQLTLATPVREGGQLRVRVDGAGSTGHGVLYLALAENRMQTKVLRGENAGHSLTHVAVLRKLVKIGSVPKEQAFTKELQVPVDAGMGAQGLRVVVFLQDSRNSHILAAAQQKL